MLTPKYMEKVRRLMHQTGREDFLGGGPCDTFNPIGREYLPVKTNYGELLRTKYAALMDMDDYQLTCKNLSRAQTNPIDPEKSQDPVYRKLAHIVNISHKSREGIDCFVTGIVYEDWMAAMEERRMPSLNEILPENNLSGEKRYKFILRTSAKKIYGMLRESFKKKYYTPCLHKT